MKMLKNVVLIVSLVLVLGRVAGVDSNTTVYLHMDDSDMGLVALTKSEGYFVFECALSGKGTVSTCGIMQDITVPSGYGYYIIDTIYPKINALRDAIMNLQELNGLR